MVARVTLAEIDAVRMSIPRALERFEEAVLPELRAVDGYEGCYVLTTPEGKALVISFWRDEEAAERSIASGLYRAHVEKFVTLLRSQPGREAYEVSLADAPALTSSRGER
jgi:heme-degrading monooxygenase HmoA